MKLVSFSSCTDTKTGRVWTCQSSFGGDGLRYFYFYVFNVKTKEWDGVDEEEVDPDIIDWLRETT